jgi:hypothetical protein
MCSGDEAEREESYALPASFLSIPNEKEFLDPEEEDRAATIALMGRATSDIIAAPASAVTPLQGSLCYCCSYSLQL